MFLDDVSYSGSQINDNLQSVLSVSESRALVGLVFASPLSVRRVRDYAKECRSHVTVLKAGTIESLSAANVKWLKENDVVFQNKSGMEVARLWDILRAYAPCRTFFEHKVADSVSLPAYMSMPLVYASPGSRSVSKATKYVAAGKTHIVQPGFLPDAAEKKKLVAAGWLYGAFCDMRRRRSSEYTHDCFKPQYKTPGLHVGKK